MLRRHFTLVLAFIIALPLFGSTPNPLPKRVLVLGDSITQDGRYVSYLEYYLHQAYPDSRSDLISIGLSSETMSGLTEADHPSPRPCVLERLDRALKEVKPQVVLVCYGMNDGIYHPASPERLAAFTSGLQSLIAKIQATGAALILITPPVFDPLPSAGKTVPITAVKFGYASPYVGYNDVLAEFARTEIALSAPGITVIDLHTAMATALAVRRKHEPNFSYTKDGVHPQDAGHLLMARVIAGGLGLTLKPVNPDTELARLASDPLFELIRIRRELRSEAWLPFVGYTKGETYKSASVKATERVVERLQLEINALAGK